MREICDWAHERDAVVVVDGAQSAPHRAVDVQALGCDFFAFSGHKLPGPSGAGVLWGREELLKDMPPFMSGGEMIQSVSLEKTSFNSLPWKFEAGTPAIVECVGLGAVHRLPRGDRHGCDRRATRPRSRPTPTSAWPPSRG